MMGVGGGEWIRSRREMGMKKKKNKLSHFIIDTPSS